MAKSNILRRAAAEGSVLLRNKNNLLPLESKTKIALFGRMQTTYYKSGTGSGGLVHIEKEPCIIDSIKNETDLILDKEIEETYIKWIEKNPFNDGGGVWAGEPWHQEEMPLSEELVKAASKRNGAAVVIIGRTAGESHDNANLEGSFLLDKIEEKNLEIICRHFEKVIVVLNVGNLINLSFLERYNVSSLLYVFHGGQEGANAIADLLCGAAFPSGKLTDTQALDYLDYPSTEGFGDEERVFYKEDIYVGYRYFETFKKDRVQFPFGFGMGYTSFDIKAEAREENGEISVLCEVKNIGNRAGKEVIEVYFKAPSEKIDTPERQLISFKKTDKLLPNESQTLKLTFKTEDMAAYDDSGKTGHKSCYVLEKGDYEIFAGTDVRSAKSVLIHNEAETRTTKELCEAMAPVISFERLTRSGYEAAPTRQIDLLKRIKDNRPQDIKFAGDKGIKLWDVKDNKNTLDEFISQFSDSALAALVCGEGMCSPKATPGTVGAFGGQTEELAKFGIPVCAVADGPSGIRFDNGTIASLIPNGTLLASSWDEELVCGVYEVVSEELYKNGVDSLLGPGINIHRNVLCGRNFEYLSEDPLLCGKIAAAATRGIAKFGAFATIKHFCANNQETARLVCDSVVSERALREIYLKGFEIAVKEGKYVLIMTSYNLVNGFFTASNYDLTTTILRNEWGFDNLVMTDWWAFCNLENGEKGNTCNLEAMVRAQNDLYMVCQSADTKLQSVLRGLENGYITRGELQRCVKNILNVIIKTHAFADFVKRGGIPKYSVSINDKDMKEICSIESPEYNCEYEARLEGGWKEAVFEIKLNCSAEPLAQVPATLKFAGNDIVFSVCRGEDIIIKRAVKIEKDGNYKFSLCDSETVEVISVKLKQ